MPSACGGSGGGYSGFTAPQNPATQRAAAPAAESAVSGAGRLVFLSVPGRSAGRAECTHRVQGAEQQDALDGVTETGPLLVRLREHRLRAEVSRVNGDGEGGKDQWDHKRSPATDPLYVSNPLLSHKQHSRVIQVVHHANKYMTKWSGTVLNI